MLVSPCHWFRWEHSVEEHQEPQHGSVICHVREVSRWSHTLQSICKAYQAKMYSCSRPWSLRHRCFKNMHAKIIIHMLPKMKISIFWVVTLSQISLSFLFLCGVHHYQSVTIYRRNISDLWNIKIPLAFFRQCIKICFAILAEELPPPFSELI